MGCCELILPLYNERHVQ